jgi:hypothetical protein
MQFPLHGKHTNVSIPKLCVRKWSLFTVRIRRNTWIHCGERKMCFKGLRNANARYRAYKSRLLGPILNWSPLSYCLSKVDFYISIGLWLDLTKWIGRICTLFLRILKVTGSNLFLATSCLNSCVMVFVGLSKQMSELYLWWATVASFCGISNSWGSLNNPTTRCYRPVVWATDSVLKVKLFLCLTN